MKIPADCISLREAVRIVGPEESIFRAARDYEIRFLTWGNNDDVMAIEPVILEPNRGIHLSMEESAETGRLVFKLDNPRPWGTTQHSAICPGDGWIIFINAGEFHSWASGKHVRKGGRPPKYDWDALEDAFIKRLESHGYPSALNEEGWRTQADVANWLIKQASKGRRDEEPSFSVAKQYAKKFMEKAKLAGLANN